MTLSQSMGFLRMLALSIAATACGSIPEGVFACTSDAECPPGWSCAAGGRCHSRSMELDASRPRVDAGGVDAGAVDAGMTDAGAVDAGMTDAGAVDAGMTDAGPQCGPCGVNAVCNGSSCECLAGFEDCDGSLGCEADTRFDANHCGGCTGVCSGATPSCVDSVCIGCASDAECVDTTGCRTGTCDTTLRACTFAVTSPSCLIGGACYASSTVNPANPCQWCDHASSPTSWSPRSASTSCDDGLVCNGADVCSGGTCVHGGLACGTSCEQGLGGCCGEPNEPCCSGDYCRGGGGLACRGGRCRFCLNHSDCAGGDGTCTSWQCLGDYCIFCPENPGACGC